MRLVCPIGLRSVKHTFVIINTNSTYNDLESVVYKWNSNGFL